MTNQGHKPASLDFIGYPGAMTTGCPPQEMRYRKLLEAATDYIYTVRYKDGEPFETLHSPGSYAISGYTPEEYGQTPFLWYEMIHPQDRELVMANLGRLMSGSPISPFEHRIIHKDGSIRWLRNTTVPSYAEDGSLLAYDALLSDITEHKASTARIAKANRAYKTLSQCNQALVRSKSEQGLLDTVCHILVETGVYALVWVGYAGRKKADFLRVAAWSGREPLLADNIKRGAPVRAQLGRTTAVEAMRTCRIVINNAPVLPPGGEQRRDFSASIVLPLFSEQCPFGVLSIHAEEIEAFDNDEVQLLTELAEDLSYGIMALRTKRKHAKSTRALAASETRLKYIFDTVQTGIFLIDRQTRRILDVNQTAAELIGLPCKKIIGRACQDFICPADRDLCPVLDQEQRIDNSEGVVLKADGTEIPVLKSVVQLDLNGRACLLESFLDISKRVQDEKERLALQGQLRQAQKMEAIGTMAGGIAHDFNNLLQAILGYAELLIRSLPKGGNSYEYARTIARAGRSATELVKQILTFSRQDEAERKPLKIQYLIKESLKLLRRTLPSTIELRQNITLSCAPVLADSSHIQQIIMNLGTNAYHALRDNGGIITVTLDEVEADQVRITELPQLAPGTYARLTVSDNGCGMDGMTRQRIFEPYFTTKKAGEGTGLGLAMVHGIINSYNGAVHVQSTPGKGSTFTLFLPTVTEKSCHEKRKMEFVMPQMRGRVLFVDDVELNVALGRLILGRLGCEVETLTDSREALDLFRAAPDDFDLVITDQTMPGLTGYELAQQMLTIRPGIPVIVITGHSETMSEEKAKAAGIRKFLMKPIDIATMTEAVEEFLLPAAGPAKPETAGKARLQNPAPRPQKNPADRQALPTTARPAGQRRPQQSPSGG